MSFSRSVVHLRFDLLEVIFCVFRQICSFGEVLPKETISVFVCPALPWAMRVAEIHLATSVFSDLMM